MISISMYIESFYVSIDWLKNFAKIELNNTWKFGFKYGTQARIDI